MNFAVSVSIPFPKNFKWKNDAVDRINTERQEFDINPDVNGAAVHPCYGESNERNAP